MPAPAMRSPLAPLGVNALVASQAPANKFVTPLKRAVAAAAEPGLTSPARSLDLQGEAGDDVCLREVAHSTPTIMSPIASLASPAPQQASFRAPAPPEAWRICSTEVIRSGSTSATPGEPSRDHLGVGAYGTVWLGSWHGVPVAVKELDSRIDDPVAFGEFAREMEAWSRLRFPSIVTLYGAFTTPTLSLVMQYCPHGALSDHLHGNPELTFELEQVLRLASQVAGAVCYMHSRNVIHRDLKSFNVLIDADGNAMLSDFGLSVVRREREAALSRAVSKAKLFATPRETPAQSPAASPPRTRRATAAGGMHLASPFRAAHHAPLPTMLSPHAVNITPQKAAPLRPAPSPQRIPADTTAAAAAIRTPRKQDLPARSPLRDEENEDEVQPLPQALAPEQNEDEPYSHPGVGLPGTTLGPLGTYGYMSPELFQIGAYSEASDAYAFGMTVWEILARAVPFGATPPLQIATAVVEGLRPPLPGFLPRPLRELMLECWSADPKARPSFKSILARLQAMQHELQEEEDKGLWNTASRRNTRETRRALSKYDAEPCRPGPLDQDEHDESDEEDADDMSEHHYRNPSDTSSHLDRGPFRLRPEDVAALSRSEREYYHAQVRLDQLEAEAEAAAAAALELEPLSREQFDEDDATEAYWADVREREHARAQEMRAARARMAAETEVEAEEAEEEARANEAEIEHLRARRKQLQDAQWAAQVHARGGSTSLSTSLGSAVETKRTPRLLLLEDELAEDEDTFDGTSPSNRALPSSGSSKQRRNRKLLARIARMLEEASDDEGGHDDAADEEQDASFLRRTVEMTTDHDAETKRNHTPVLPFAPSPLSMRLAPSPTTLLQQGLPISSPLAAVVGTPVAIMAWGPGKVPSPPAPSAPRIRPVSPPTLELHPVPVRVIAPAASSSVQMAPRSAPPMIARPPAMLLKPATPPSVLMPVVMRENLLLAPAHIQAAPSTPSAVLFHASASVASPSSADSSLLSPRSPTTPSNRVADEAAISSPTGSVVAPPLFVEAEHAPLPLPVSSKIILAPLVLPRSASVAPAPSSAALAQAAASEPLAIVPGPAPAAAQAEDQPHHACCTIM